MSCLAPSPSPLPYHWTPATFPFSLSLLSLCVAAEACLCCSCSEGGGGWRQIILHSGTLVCYCCSTYVTLIGNFFQLGYFPGLFLGKRVVERLKLISLKCLYTLQRKSHLCSIFWELCVCERFIYSQDRSTYLLQQNTHRHMNV